MSSDSHESRYTISERNGKSLLTEPDCVGSIASVPRLVDTPRIPWSDASDERIFHRDTGFFIVAFCCCSAALEKYA